MFTQEQYNKAMAALREIYPGDMSKSTLRSAADLKRGQRISDFIDYLETLGAVMYEEGDKVGLLHV